MVCNRLALGFVFAILASVFAGGTYAQMAGTGVVVGTVTDPSGAAVAGALVTLTDLSTNSARTATTSEKGLYSFANVPPGKYNVAISKTGFRQVKFGDQEVVVGESRTHDAKLEIGTSSEIVEVVATNTELQTMNATIGTTVTGLPLESLPSLGRDVSTFVSLQPGVTPEGSVAGAVYDQNSFQLDGGNNSSDMDGSQNVYTPSAAGDPTGGLTNFYFTGTGGGGPTGVMPTPVDSIEEFKVGTSNQTADFNSSAGAQVQMVTKRGTDTWHGTAYEYYLDNLLNANVWDNLTSSPATARPGYHYNRFGAAGGGDLTHKEVLGGKWYFFANYEGFRWNNSSTVTRAVPSDAMKQGILQYCIQNCTYSGGYASNAVFEAFNLNPAAAVYNGPSIGALTSGQTVQPAICTATPGDCDPRGLGISPSVAAMWSQYMPEATLKDASGLTTGCGGLSRCDHLNVMAFRANVLIPWTDNFGVARLDHDFGQKWHFYATYHYYKLVRATTNQIDIGGFFKGDKLGVPASVANRPQVPWYLTGGLTTNISANVTNSFNYNYLRNYWARASAAQPPQVSGLGGALEPFGESSTNVLSPFNVDTQNVRTRFWDGQDHMIRDDVSWVKGTHFLQFGGTYQHNWNYHQRTDNGGGVNYQTVYQMGLGGSMDLAGYTPPSLTGGNNSRWVREYGIVMGVPIIDQIAYTRTGKDLNLNPPNTPAFDQSTIPFYNLYFSDSWRMKPTFTLTYGLGWTLEMPPTEAQGKQVTLVDTNNKPISVDDYLFKRQTAALQGQVYNPIVGFVLNGNVSGHPKYPYNPYYKSFSPRIAAAWNPSFDSGLLGSLFGTNKTVIRGGYGILYGRLNGVDLVLVPLLGTGLIQAVQCNNPVRTGGCAGSAANPVTAFRIGPTSAGFDGLTAPLPAASPTLPQPDYPGVNAIAAGAGEGLDPNFRPNMSQQFTLSVQRQFGPKIIMEAGYVGRKLTHEYQPINLNAVPYMLTINGQSFAKAYGQMVWQYCGGASGLAGGNCAGNLSAVTPQPFFEKAMNAAYCAGFTSCTQAVASNEASNIAGNAVWSLYSDLDKGGFNNTVIPRSMMNTPLGTGPCTATYFGCDGQLSSGVGMNTSIGYANYNAAYVSLKTSSFHGVTMQTNFTYGKALGTGAQVQATSQYTVPDPYNLHSAYGLQPWDRKFVWNMWLVYQPNFYKTQHGVLGHIVGGWTISPILSIGSGLPDLVQPTDNNIGFIYGGGQSWGEADGVNFGALQNAINMCGPGVGGSSRHNNPLPSSQGLGSNGFGPSMYQNPDAVYSCFRNPILGIDGSAGGGGGIIRGQMYWNVDMSLKKEIRITERVSTEFTWNVYNIFNHPQLADPYNLLGDQGDFGALEGQVNTPRQMQFGLRVRF
jgi:hypothetical protein